MQVTSPKAGDVVDASQGFTITWTSGAGDPSTVEIFIGEETTQFSRELAINVSVSLGSYAVPPIQGLVPDGSGYEIVLDAVGGGEGTTSGQFSVIESTPSESSAPTSTSNGTATVTASASSSLVTSSASSAPAPATTTTATPSPTTVLKNTSGLSSGIKAGIGVGVAAGVIILLTILALLLFRHRKQKHHRVGGDDSVDDGDIVPPDIAEAPEEFIAEAPDSLAERKQGKDKPGPVGDHEWPRAELPTEREPQELPA
ncbi:hypothetical protein VTN77DRAFT_7744 [Rasamsonia byssochlamydoides]|uniref:uncharacterized protein n=1 Tax=Rasamsonia byssochlamydoides TaxID=89139 RepID=UPI0037421B2C